MHSRSWIKGSVCLLLIALGLPLQRAAGVDFDLTVLNPRTYRAPAARYALTVDPGDRYGRGEAAYRLTEGTTECWSATLPFTLWEAAVTDDGTVAGYAYTGRANGDFVVAILDAKGTIRLKETTKRASSRYLHTNDNPAAAGLIVDGPNDRMVVRVVDPDVNRGWETWWVYRLSTATAIEKLTPAELMPDREPARAILDARPVPGTPLTLLHWWRYDYERDRNSVGARFTLVDLKGKPVWTMELPKDYSVPGDEQAETRLRNAMRTEGGILRSDRPKRFDLFFAAESQRVTFAVRQEPADRWNVTEVSRVPHSLNPPLEPKPPVPNGPLEYLGPVVLQIGDRSTNSPFRKVHRFGFDGEGRMAFVRTDEKTGPVLVLVDQAGDLQREIGLKVDVKADSQWSACWVGESRFVVTASDAPRRENSQAWWVDAKSGDVQAIADFDCPWIERLVGFADGRFTALARRHSGSTIETAVIGFDDRGRRAWTLADDINNKGRNALFGVEDIARTSRDEIVVLENIRRIVKCFDRSGRYQREFDLKQAWGRNPNYPTEVSADVDGGFVIRDFRGKLPFVRMRADGTVRSGLAPTFPDGKTLDTREIQAAPDGRLWAADGDCIVRLTEEGVVDRVLGPSPNVDELGDIAGMTVDRNARVHAVDSRTGSIHVFDRAGQRVHVCRASATDVDGRLGDPSLTVDDRGEVYLRLGDRLRGDVKFAHFSSDGARLEDMTLTATELHSQPGTGHFIALGYESVRLKDRLGTTLRTIRRRPDGSWFEHAHAVGVAPDGSFAVVDRSVASTVNLYRLDGDPIRSFTLPESAGAYPAVTYDGSRLVVTGRSGLLLFDGSGTLLQEIDTPQVASAKKQNCRTWFVAEARELLVFDGETPTLHRYAMPAAK